MQNRVSTGRTRTKMSKIEQLKVIIEAWAMNLDEILTKEALSILHGTVVDPEQGQIEAPNQALKLTIIKELQSR